MDDDDLVREAARRILQRGGHRVIDAAHAEAALALSPSEHSPQVLLTEVVLPGLSGLRLAERLRERGPRLRVVYMSGRSGLRASDGQLKPNSLYVAKPFTPERLLMKVREALNEPET